MSNSRIWSFGPLQLRINWLILACVLLTVFGLLRLGVWQFSRAGEKLAIQEAFEAQQLQRARPIASLDLSTEEPEQLSDLHVSLSGEFINQRAILVQAQFFEGQIGYEVITPFRMEDSDQLVLVSRGWTTGILPPNTPPNLRPVDGPLELTGQIHIPRPDRPVIASQIDASRWPLRVRSLEIDVLDSIFGEQLFPYAVRLTEDQPGMLVRHWPETNADVDTHLSYALQWFTFAVVVALIALFASSNLLALMREPDKASFEQK